MLSAFRRAGGRATRQLQPNQVAPIGVRSLHLLKRSVVNRTGSRTVHLAAPSRGMSSVFDAHDKFVHRHVGPSTDADIDRMLEVVGEPSVEALIAKTVPKSIRTEKALDLGPERGEAELLAEFKKMMKQNQVLRSFIGQGYYGTHVPKVILRSLLENPAWYTPYTPYQAEISQGRLEMLLNYQTMVCDMTGLPVSNASLLDEATAAAEAMQMCYSLGKKGAKQFLVDSKVHPQTIDVMRTRADGYGIELVVGDYKDFNFDSAFGCIVQYPDTEGSVNDFSELAGTAHLNKAKIVVASDLLALSKLTPPGEWGADVVVGSAQRFGVPMGFGGPHAAFFACQDAWKRKMPGRIIGVSRDSRGLPALRMAMQTREQHIRRDKATSNICTAQALLANMSAAFAVYHGPKGIDEISTKVHAAAKVFAHGMRQAGMKVMHADFFDTVTLSLEGAKNPDVYVAACEAAGMNIRKIDEDTISIAFDETVTAHDVNSLVETLSSARGHLLKFDAEAVAKEIDIDIPAAFKRTSEYLTHPVFNMYHSETEMMRYLYLLEGRDLSLCTAMIPLGSCTMKLNAASEMIPVTWPEVGNIHPFAPEHQTKGYMDMLASLEKDLAEITGFHAVSMQPNAGSQGEYSGLLAISNYHKANGDVNRKICLIPTSAHGTNPASAVMAGMKVVVVKCDADGNIDFSDLKSKVEKHKDNLAALMVTYPSTHGVFEENIVEVCDLIHANGGQVYMDGANMNAQVGLCSPGEIGADVCHLNLHKTFCIPHGGGGPGMGPIGVAKQLAPFLPGHSFKNVVGEQASGAVAATPFSSASILPITWMYINLMGAEGLTDATKIAILNANYMAKRLEGHFDVLFKGSNGTVAHEFIIDLRHFKQTAGIVEEDVAKRLIDYNFHSPTMSWPVVGTLMVEPTESESLYELDRMCDALIAIREEIREIEDGKADRSNNLLKNAPHTADMVNSDTWDKPYSRERAAYPVAYLRNNKFWAFVSRLDNVYGDRNVVCTCPPLESYSS